MPRKLISFDWAIKKILRSKANFGILEGFLSELLFTEIRILEVLESESNQDKGFDKYNRVDIKVIDADQQIIIIEIQYLRELDYLQRILFASAKTISEHLTEGTAYAEVSKVISVNILYFDFGKGDDYIYHGTTNFIGMHNHSVLELNEDQKKLYKAEKIADIYPEYYLIEVKNFNDIAKDSLDEWIYFFKNEQIKEDFTARGLRQAKETLDVLKMNEQERYAYEYHQEQLHYEASMYESSYIAAKLEGKAEGILITAKNMKQAGIPVATIAQVTGLSIAQIEVL
ncbi:Rpn family recombination-promoting nuclease/putative transposase [Candidatus Venteria ishoeyi]|uniref:PD-(D/E)XK nuclease family transposase n=1 Tax=Candidatus Venteria ishoeyi TaxID=1899563 RepID=A0A1H6FBL7_9GAMM|nr:Rpn family recombination-promoting nuclease/putative transposase [Candidatus Venteria ishoeyi]MDM8545984.1 Rpn family recombination-promoting nuclease/putative transposase [Candidatus Venteria ishoeyi]SEH06771.1 PD-(D/E)XK nuclease family transposase [Candidatus Venteria ishoeyi]